MGIYRRLVAAGPPLALRSIVASGQPVRPDCSTCRGCQVGVDGAGTAAPRRTQRRKRRRWRRWRRGGCCVSRHVTAGPLLRSASTAATQQRAARDDGDETATRSVQQPVVIRPTAAVLQQSSVQLSGWHRKSQTNDRNVAPRRSVAARLPRGDGLHLSSTTADGSDSDAGAATAGLTENWRSISPSYVQLFTPRCRRCK